MFYYKTYKQLRISKKITHEKLSKILDVNLSTLSRWETGKIEPPKTAVIALAHTLGVNIAHISDYTDINQDKERLHLDSTSLESREDIPKEIKAYIQSLKEEKIDQQKSISRLERQTILLKNLPLIIYTKDNKLKYTYANNKLANLIGGLNSIGNIIGYHSYSFFGESDYLELLNFEKAAILEGREILDEIITIPGTKKQKKGLLNIFPHYDDSGAISEIRCSIRDITDRYKVEMDRKRLEEVVNQLKDYYIWIGHKNNPDDGDDKIIFDYKSQNNIEAEKILESNPDKFLTPPSPKDIRWLKSKKYPKTKIHDVVIGEKFYKVKDMIYKKDDIYFGITSNITEITTLNKENEMLKEIIDRLPIFIWMANSKNGKIEDAKLTYLSKNVEDILGVPYNEIISSKYFPRQKQLMPSDQVEKFEKALKKKTFPVKVHYHINVPRNNRKKYLESNIFKDGNIYYGYVKEIT